MGFPISAWAVRRPVAPLVIFLLLGVLGLLAWRALPVQGMPSIVIPLVNVSISQMGAAPEDLERQVARRVEAGLAGLTGVKHMTTVVNPGTVTTTIEFTLTTPVDRAVSDVQQAISQVRPSLPAGVMEPIISRIDIDGGAIQTYVVGGDGRSPEELSWFVDDVLARRLQGVPGVAQVRREGGVDREVQVRLDPAKLAVRGLSAASVDEQVRGAWADLPGGRLDATGSSERVVRVLATQGGVAGLRTLRIGLPDGRSVALEDLGEISDGPAEATSMARFDGRPVVAFSLFRAKGYSEVTVADQVAVELDRLRGEQQWARIELITDLVLYTRETFDSAIFALLEGALLAVIVVWVFLRAWRATVICGVAIPLSVIPAFAAMQVCGFSLNGISLLALSLVSGILVDDAIVEIENIVRHQRLGMSPYKAAIYAADRIGLAVVATTMTIVAVFLPVSFMGGIPGKYFIEFGLTVTFAVLASLLVARLITPLMSGYLLTATSSHADRPGRVTAAYRKVLALTIDHPWRTLGCGALFLIGSFSLVPLLPSGFVARGDYGQATARVDLPPGMPLAQADRTVAELVRRIRERPEVAGVFAKVAVPQSQLTIRLVPRSQRSLSSVEWQRAVSPVLSAVPDQRFGFLGDNQAREVQLMLTADEGADLAGAARSAAAAMRRLPQLANVTTAADLPRPEIRLVPRPDAVAQLGVSSASIAQLARIATLGNDDTVLSKLELDGRQVPVRVLIDPSYRSDPAVLAGLRVPTAGGGTVPLAAVADLIPGSSAGSIERFDRRRRIAIEADLGSATLGEALDAAKALPELQNLPPGVQLVSSGDAEIMAELFTGFAIAMALGVLLVYLVLVLLYRDFLHPVTILTALPLSAGGAFAALLLANLSLDLSSLIGLLMLMGIVCKNTILVVDAAITHMHEGHDRRSALLEAGTTRARPIIMTTLAMVAGMVPIAFGLGADAAFRRPMALAVIGGLITSTVLSLVLVPAVFVAIDRLRGRLLSLGARLVRVPSAAEREAEAGERE